MSEQQKGCATCFRESTKKELALDIVKILVPAGWGIAMLIGFFVYGIQAGRWIPGGVCLFNSLASLITLVDICQYHLSYAHRYQKLAQEKDNKPCVAFKLTLTALFALGAIGTDFRIVIC